MKCTKCGEEIVLAERCPYCGAEVPEREQKQARERAEAKGQFRGAVGSKRAEAGRTGHTSPSGAGPLAYIGALVRLLSDPEVSVFKKLAIGAAAAYVLSPMDLIPDLVLGLGWLDDAAVVAFVWRYVSDQLRRYLR